MFCYQDPNNSIGNKRKLKYYKIKNKINMAINI